MRQTLLLTMFLIGCGTDVMTDTPDANNSGGYQALVSGNWTLQPTSEKYVCVRKTVDADMYVKAIRPIAPLGTHHTVLMLGPVDAPDGTVDCMASLVKPVIYASGVGTQPLEMPDGVAIHLKKGDQLLLNLHLFNTDEAPLSGTSGIEFMAADPVDAAHSAGVVLAGKMTGLEVDPVTPPNSTTQTGACTMSAGMTVFAMAPHMHLLGSHMKVDYIGTMLMDQDYTFDGQRFNVLAPFVTTAGGKLNVECTYQNYGSQIVYFGESTTAEMCFAITYAYPAPTVETCTK